VQRREYFRLPTPGGKTPIICRIPLPNAEEGSQEEQTLELPLFDVSVGGIGLVVLDALHEAISIGAHFDNCKIDFPGIGTTNLTLCVRNIRHVIMKNDTAQHRVGLEFINPSRGNQSLIQRYTFALESESLSIPGG
jgi:c-di-GMP-binding flagellar brake protein YcgR